MDVPFDPPKRVVRVAALALTLLALPMPARANSSLSSRNDAPAASLQIPASAWPSGSGTPVGRALDPTSADSPGVNLFAGSPFHKVFYAAKGLQSGYLQQALLKVNEAGFNAEVDWLGTAYDSPAGA